MEGETITGNTPRKRLLKYTISVRGRVPNPTGSEIALPVLWLGYEIVVQRMPVKRNREYSQEVHPLLTLSNNAHLIHQEGRSRATFRNAILLISLVPLQVSLSSCKYRLRHRIRKQS